MPTNNNGRVYPPPQLPNCRECICLASCLTNLGDLPIDYIQIRPLGDKCPLILDYITIEKIVRRRIINGGDYTHQEISFMRIQDLVDMFNEIGKEYINGDT